MCKQCNKFPVYEFTNKRKLCARCFVNYFEKKLLYTIRKFEMIKQGDIIGYKYSNNFKSVVLENVLEMVARKSSIKIVKLPNKKANKVALDSSLDSESKEISNTLIDGNSKELEKYLPVVKNQIKPLYLFLDKEILLYVKIKKLKFKKTNIKENKISEFLEESEKKHPELKRAIVNGVLKMYKN